MKNEFFYEFNCIEESEWMYEQIIGDREVAPSGYEYRQKENLQ